MRLRNAGERFFVNFQLVDGPRFRGNLGSLSQGDVPASFSSLSRSLRVKPGADVNPGDLFTDPHGQVWAVGLSDFGIDFKQYQVVQMLKLGTLYRRDESTDSVTGLSKNDSSPQDMGKIYYSLEGQGTANDAATNLSTNEFSLLTPTKLQLNDVVDGLRVRSVTTQGGLDIATVTQQ